jgi:hypothetical protein
MISAAIRDQVRMRARNQCEYCHLPQSAAAFFSFHIEHVRAKQHGGPDDPSNLALACPDCNAHKGPNLSTIDPMTNALVPVFDPRRHAWEEHFEMDGSAIVGLTAIGRGTVELLKMNDMGRLEMRAELLR